VEDRDLSDEDAYMALALNNAQGELHPLERGMHALGVVERGKHGKSVEAYAKAVGRDTEIRSVRREIAAAEVMAQIGASADFVEHWSPLAELHPAPKWLWRALVSRLVSEGWTVEQARGRST
jgi:ParB-like chromosome segregation protein Spo0J